MGDGVNIATRVEGIADAGGICLSEEAYRQVRDASKKDWSSFPPADLKARMQAGQHSTAQSQG